MTCFEGRLSDIGDWAAQARAFLEPHWLSWKLQSGRDADPMFPISAGMCGFTSSFLVTSLTDVFGGNWFIQGGRPRDGGGIVDGDGRLRGHFWVVSEYGELVDLTADQYGHSSIVVASFRDRRYAATFSETDIAIHLPKVKPVSDEWMDSARMESALLPQTSPAMAA